VDRKRALITGVTGQDGSYLAEYLLELGYEVHGAVRSTTADIRMSRIGHLAEGEHPAITLHITDLTDGHSLMRLVNEVRPTEVYNLAAQSHVAASFDQPIHTGNVSGLGVIRVLEAVRQIDPTIRFYQACSSEMFGSTPPPQNEETPFHPRSPYAVAKVYSYWTTVNYREAYGIHASNGILFNHESPRRGRYFVTRKITDSLASVVAGEIKRFSLGNLDAKRDWGHARDYVKAMHMITQYAEPLDLVIGTGESRSVRDFLDAAAAFVNLNWEDHVEIDPALYRPSEVDYLRADPTRAFETIGWKPETSFQQLVEEMMRADLAAHGVTVE
jgi:GDPmannose 4,6-dehydratase